MSGPLLLNLFLYDFQFFPDLHITNYRDDNTSRSTNKNLNMVFQDLEKESITLFKWFTENLMIANPETSYLSKTTREIRITIVGMAICSGKC